MILWVDAKDCMPPHGLDLSSRHDSDKVCMLVDCFESLGFDKQKPALVGYPLDGMIQLLSGTHRHFAADLTGIKLPVVLWRRVDIERAWGQLEDWLRVMEDIPVVELEGWTREDIEKRALYG